MNTLKPSNQSQKRYRPTFAPSVKFTVYLAPDVVAKIRRRAGRKKTLSMAAEEILRSGLDKSAA